MAAYWAALSQARVVIREPLVAAHTASRALAVGDCDVAVAAGVNLVLAPRTTREVAKTGALLPDGRSRPFDASANGFVRAEACGAVVLKRLSDRVRDRVWVYAVIMGSAINQDGRTEITIPRQAVVLEAAAGARASVCSYGMSGTNAYAVLAARYRDYLAGLEPGAYPAFAYTATHSRTRQRHAVWVEASSLPEARAGAHAVSSGAGHEAIRLLDQAAEPPWPSATAPRSVTSIPTYPWQHSSHVIPGEEKVDSYPSGARS